MLYLPMVSDTLAEGIRVEDSLARQERFECHIVMDHPHGD
jgi:hypothetical protein